MNGVCGMRGFGMAVGDSVVGQRGGCERVGGESLSKDATGSHFSPVTVCL